VSDKECSWAQEVDSEELTSNSEISSSAKKEAYTDITKIIKENLSSPTISRLLKRKSYKIRPQPNLAAALKKRMKPLTK